MSAYEDVVCSVDVRIVKGCVAFSRNATVGSLGLHKSVVSSRLLRGTLSSMMWLRRSKRCGIRLRLERL